MENKTELDPQRQEKAKEYARINRRLMLVGLIIAGLYSLAWLLFGWAESLRSFLENYLTHPWLLVAGFVAIFGGINYLITLPLNYYSGFVLPHRFEMSNQSFKEWVVDEIKGILLGAALGGLILELIYLVLRTYPETWWLWAAGLMLVFNVILANLAPVLLFPIFYDFEPLGEEHEDLVERLTRLAEQAGTNVKGVFKFDMSRRTKAANAGLTGLGNTRRIILGDTLLDEFEDDEIETIIAHELGHHVHNDIPIGIAVESVVTLVGFYIAGVGLRWGVSLFGLEGVADIAAFPVFLLAMGAYGLMTMPLGNAFSRWRERRADTYALKATDKPDAFVSAMTRLANQNLAEIDPEPWVEILLYSHPTLKKRIEMAEAHAS
jgi:STE24 endopeptidase